MRWVRFFGVAIAIAFALPALARNDKALSIRVLSGDWGQVRTVEIEGVLKLVASVMLDDFPDVKLPTLVVEYAADGPKALFDTEPSGARRILLNVRDARWDQFAYQFSHELCHVLSNYERRNQQEVVRHHQWFEESLCEAVSLLTLGRIAIRWQESPPHAGWEDYAVAFREYGDALRRQSHRALADRQAASWIARHIDALERDPYRRRDNEAFAAALVPLLETAPLGTRSLAYLNLSPPSKDSTFAAYLQNWLDCCPEEGRGFVRQVMSLLPGAG